MCAYLPWVPNNSQWQLSSDHAEKANLGNTRDNDTKTRKVWANGNKHCPGKNGGNVPSSLGSRSISVGRQVGIE